ncbi:MAG TPA: endonuclease/exonuclease/phosphatase family protein [Gemmatimonadales bacterium]|nr:endonuclease/exonuclease/phosphatase family protein [Gemmatimonadales bacterium]
MKIRLLCLTLAAAACGCTDNPASVRPQTRLTPAAGDAAAGAEAVTALTQNMYVGADLDIVIGALASPNPSDDIPALLGAIQTLEETDYPARAGALAAEIAKARPHVVGLQEVSRVDVDLTALGLPTVLHLDFLGTLQDSLAARGLHYVTAGQVENIVARPVPGIGLVDYDAMLVDADRVTITAAAGQNYTHNIGVVAPGIELKRGWVDAQVIINGAPYTFASTHLESGQSAGFPELRAAQAAELVGSLPTDQPAIVMGDLNDNPGTPMYQVIAGGQFTDSWRALRPGAVGLTCCEPANLANQIPTFDQRLDYVWVRGAGSLQGAITRIGDTPGDRVAGPAHPVWPSDHAGLVFSLLVAPGGTAR